MHLNYFSNPRKQENQNKISKYPVRCNQMNEKRNIHLQKTQRKDEKQTINNTFDAYFIDTCTEYKLRKRRCYGNS